MRNLHVEECCISLSIREMKIKTIMGYHYRPIRMAKKKILLTTANAGEDEEKLNHSYITDSNAEWPSHSGRA